MPIQKHRLASVECAAVVLAGILFFVSTMMAYHLSVINIYGWIGIMGNAAVYTSLFGALLFLVGGSRLRWGILVLFLYLFLVDCILVFVRVNFDMQLDGSWVAIVFDTSRDELKAFFQMHVIF